MHVEFYGAAGGVTGSMHRVVVGDVEVLLDCGMFQGHRAEANRRNRELPGWAPRAHALVLSHAHLDHSGGIPTLVKRGFEGNVYCTPATRDLCSVMLRDSATLQQQEANYINRRLAREGSDERVEPLYDTDDAQAAVERMIGLPLHRPMLVAPGVTVTLHDSGHVLGSSLVQLDLEERGVRRRLLFTGDLGRDELPLLNPPERVDDVDVLLTESTYGDRLHPDPAHLEKELGEIVEQTIGRGGRVYIPTFALERAQEVLFTLERLSEAGKLPQVPIYMDSPLAIAITEIYKLHPGQLHEDVRDRILGRDDPFSPPGLRYVSQVADSKAVQASGEPCIVIAGAGMCEGGRIVFHFIDGLSDPRNSVVIVGFMAEHTLGRRLVEQRRKVRVLGVERELRARVHALEGLSAHADQKDLVQFVRDTVARGRLKHVALVHGEERPRETLAEELADLGGVAVTRPMPGDRLEL